MEHQGHALKEIIDRMGYTQKEFAALIGFDRAYLSRSLSKAKISPRLRRETMRALRVDEEQMDAMLKGEGKPAPKQPVNKHNESARLIGIIESQQQTIQMQQGTISTLVEKVK